MISVSLVSTYRCPAALHQLGFRLLARFAATAKASAVQRLPDERRVATLVAFILNLETVALDDALDLLDIVITEIFSDAKNAGEKARLRRIKDLDAAAIQLSHVCRLILDQNVPDAALREAVFAAVAQEIWRQLWGRWNAWFDLRKTSITKSSAIASVASAPFCQASCERCVSARRLQVILSWRRWSIFAK